MNNASGGFKFGAVIMSYVLKEVYSGISVDVCGNSNKLKVCLFLSMA